MIRRSQEVILMSTKHRACVRILACLSLIALSGLPTASTTITYNCLGERSF